MWREGINMTIKFFCVCCGKESERYEHKQSGKRIRALRPSHSITCSPKCSKEWTRRNNNNKNRK